MKLLSAFILSAAFISTTSANAALLLNKDTAKANLHDLSNVLVTVHTFATPPYAAEFIEQDYVGTSASAPCSDLKPSFHDLSPNLYGYFNDETIKLTTQELMDEYGQALTCIKTTITVIKSRTVYSTGNILLLWDDTAKSYSAATPNKISLDMSRREG